MIRQATATDAPATARLIILAMAGLAAKFVGDSDPAKAISLFERFVRLTDNQYSFQNTLVYEDETGVCGAIIAYNGAALEMLRIPFLEYIRETYNVTYQPEAETQVGEYYIDCLGVFEGQQGKGIGKKLIKALIEKVIRLNYDRIGLIVSCDNPHAEKLYLSLGFKVINTTQFMGDDYLHMQYDCGGNIAQ